MAMKQYTPDHHGSLWCAECSMPGRISERRRDAGADRERRSRDICDHLINDQGELCDEALDERTVSVPLAELKRRNGGLELLQDRVK